MMKANEVRTLSIEEVQERIRDETEQLSELTFRHAIAHLENPMLIREKRRFIARLMTVLKQHEADGHE